MILSNITVELNIDSEIILIRVVFWVSDYYLSSNDFLINVLTINNYQLQKSAPFWILKTSVQWVKVHA